MRRTSVVKLVAIAVLASFALTPAASAQQPAQPMQPQPTQPDLFQETLKAQRSTDQAQGFYQASAVAANFFVLPGRAITCAAGAVAGVGMLLLTFGSGYKYFAGILGEGCGGKWIVSADDMRPDRPVNAVDWQERPAR